MRNKPRPDEREADSAEDACDQRSGGKHTGRSLIFRFHNFWRVHHAQRAEVTTCETHSGGNEPIHPIISDEYRKYARNFIKLIVAHQKERDKNNPQCNRYP